ncbi:MAG TPA: glutathione synthase [Actinomycetota bacterium]|nr:glutathione synthase [Actinomycetota bacterium]
MRVAFLIDDLQSEDPRYTTTRLARAAIERGHEVTYIGIGDLAYEEDDRVTAIARRLDSHGSDLNDFLERARNVEAEQADLDRLDVLMLRNDPLRDVSDRPWAQTLGIIFGELLVSRGVLVVNDPMGLSKALNKLYLQRFPQEVRPATLVSRNTDAIKEFVTSHGDAVLKPLQGSGGQAVFLVRREDHANLNQMIEAVARDGYVVAQEYLPQASEGDLRLFMMNGRPLRSGSAVAAFRRISESEDFRSNMSAGGRSEPAEIDDEVLHIAEAVGDRLVQDGMFLVGLDLAGSKLMEVNVFSPGGLGSASEFTGVDFAAEVIEALEAKVEAKASGSLSNAELAVWPPQSATDA